VLEHLAILTLVQPAHAHLHLEPAIVYHLPQNKSPLSK
jgi:hypothetical protein